MEKESVNRVLFDFYSIIDTDIGIALLMNRDYNSNTAVINMDAFGKTIDQYKLLMLNRSFSNPLFMFLNAEYRKDADDLYRDMTVANPDIYKTILNMSITTSIYEMMQTSKNYSAIKSTVLCWNKMQSEYVKRLDPEIETIIYGNTPIDVTNYDSLILKFIYPPEVFFACGEEYMNGKNVYFCRYKFNMSETNINKLRMCDYLKQYHDSANDIYIIEVYANATLDTPKEEL